MGQPGIRHFREEEPYIFVAVHAQAFYFVDDLITILIRVLRAGLGDLAAHVCEKILRKTLRRHCKSL